MEEREKDILPPSNALFVCPSEVTRPPGTRCPNLRKTALVTRKETLWAPGKKSSLATRGGRDHARGEAQGDRNVLEMITTRLSSVFN